MIAPHGMEFLTTYPISACKTIYVGLVNCTPTVALSEKKSVLYLDKEDWKEMTDLSSRIVKYFQNRNKEEISECQGKFKNVICNFTKKGRNRVVRFENLYPWTITIRSPQMVTLDSPIVSYNKKESLSLCRHFKAVEDNLVLLERIGSLVYEHRRPEEPLNLSLPTLSNNSLLNSSWDGSSLLKSLMYYNK